MANLTRFQDLEMTDYASNCEQSGQEISAQLRALLSYIGTVTSFWTGQASTVFTGTVAPAIEAELNGLVATLNELAADVRTSSIQLDTEDATAASDVSRVVSALAGISKL